MMPIKIKVKLPKSSNKPKTLSHKSDPEALQSQSEAPLPQPFIDRLSITGKVSTLQEGKDMFHAYLNAQHDKVAFKFSPRPSSSYNRACRIMLPSVADSEKWPFYEFSISDKCVTRFRIDFVPVDLGEEGMQELHVSLTSLMDGGWGYILKHGKISRLDVAVDFPTLRMTDFHLLPKQAATTKQWAVSGELKGFQHGKPNGNHTMIYNRKAKRINQKKPWKGKEGIRRRKNLKIPVTDLPALTNVFQDISMVQRVVGPPEEEKKPYIWKLFMDAAEQKGLPATLAQLPVKKRTLYRKLLKQHVVEWWEIRSLWAQWPEMLAELKIADPAASS